MNDLTIITTLYNCEKFIKESIDSILNQTYTKFKWIILNDGSTDATWDIVNTINDDRITRINRKDNKKIPYSRNECIQMADTKYVAIHDGDDISLSHRMESQIEFLENNENVFACGGWAIAIDQEGVEQELMNYPSLSHHKIVNQFLSKKQNPMIDPTTMFRKKDFINLGEYSLDDSIYLVPDMDLWRRAIVNGRKLNNLSQPLIKYRINPNGMTRKHKTDMIHAHMKVWRQLRNEFISEQAGENRMYETKAKQ